MEAVRQYFIGVVAAAVICGIVTGLFPGKGASAQLVKLISGVMLSLLVLGPISGLKIRDVSDFWASGTSAGEDAALDGEILARDSMAAIIKENCEAYILDKAQSLGLEVTVEVSLSDDDIPAPEFVRIRGNVSPYLRTKMQSILESELGIAKENQLWIG